MKRILLISPDADNEALWVTGDEGPCAEVLNNFVPLGLATVAGLTPIGFEVDIWDEVVHGRFEAGTPLPKPYDLVGVTGYKSHIGRCLQLGALFRSRGLRTAMGGPGVSSSPHEYRDHFDILFIGEVEETWPRFLRDWEAGSPGTEYRQIEKPDMAASPAPQWDSIAADLTKYSLGGVQTTRGCPFDCEFCDVIYLFGRRARHKPIAQVIEEVRTLQRLGMTSVFFCDDEFIGDRAYAKDLLRALITANNAFPRPLTYSTQLTMNVSKDPELLELMADANFDLVFIGIETPNRESLKETHKFQNLRDDLAADVRRILSYGISIRSGIIVGFDHDGPDIFDIQYDFIQRACLPSLAINMLKAPLGTKLWSRLRLEGRVVSMQTLRGKGHPRTYTNILPKLLSRVQLLEGYRDLLQRLYRWEAFAERMIGLASAVTRPPRVREQPLSLEEALRLTGTLPDDAGAHDAMRAILEHTTRVAPFMLRRVKNLIVQHHKYRGTLQRLYPQIEDQLEIERRADLRFVMDDRSIPIPPEFRASFNRVFPDLHRRVWLNLADPGRAAEALREVFVDFLVRWGEEFRALEPHHVVFLNEICDRTCAKFNGQAPETFVPVEGSDAPVPDVKRLRLADDVLMSVEQELVRFNRQPAPGNTARP
jgi:radical SAM superfamily enzyme YgiQ (UPF0313 family)